MKLFYFLLAIFAGILTTTAQTDGLSYQAVIIDPDPTALPGTNSTDNVLLNIRVTFRFSIYDSQGAVEYQEIQNTITDEYGMVSLIIGSGVAQVGQFTSIFWDGTKKDLGVELNLDGTFNEFEKQTLLFIPYAYHREAIVDGDLTVNGDAIFDGDLTVNGLTNLNNNLNVNNAATTTLTGSLEVDGITLLNNDLTVTNGSDTNLDGELTVEGNTKLNGSLEVESMTTLQDSLYVLNNSPSYLTGTLTVDGNTLLKSSLAVDGTTTLNDSLSVLNNSPTLLTGSLRVSQIAELESHLTVGGVARVNDSLSVLNGSPTLLSGILEVEGVTDLNNDLNVQGISNLNNDLNVLNGSSTNLGGNLNVDGLTILNNELTVNGVTTINNDLEVTNASPTTLSGTLDVVGDATFESNVEIEGNTSINGDLEVLGNTQLNEVEMSSFELSSDSPEFVALIENTNPNNGDGLVIKLGRTHGSWNNGSHMALPNISNTVFGPALNTVSGWLDGATVNTSDIVSVLPNYLVSAQAVQVTNSVINEINNALNLPVSTPPIYIPETVIFQRTPIFGGQNLPHPIPDIPPIVIPELKIPHTELIPGIQNFIPEIPQLNLPNSLPSTEIPNFNFVVVNNSLTKENEFIRFVDKDDRILGRIRAQSTQDWLEEEVLQDAKVLEFLAELATIDVVEATVGGIVYVNSLIDKFNKLGVEYASGHGDYAEWLERRDYEENITAGDIVGIIGGKISKDLKNAEQVMVVSYRPIVLGNAPEDDQLHRGNNVAFMGQVPVKVMGPVQSGDYIIAHPEFLGYGIAKKPLEMNTQDFKTSVGRSWDTNQNDGPKMVNTVVGIHNGDWVGVMKNLQEKHKELKERVEKLNALADELLKD